MKLRSFVAAARIALVLPLLMTGVAVEAAEINVIAGAGFSPALGELGPQFERMTGHKLVIQYGIGGALKKRLDSGEAFDLAIFPAGLLDDAAKQGKIADGTRIVIGRAGMAAATRAGAPKPDISSVDAFKRALLSATSVTYLPESAVGIHLTKVFERLGITDQMKAKTKPQKSAEQLAPAVASGQAELGFAPSTIFASASGVEPVGPFPSELQSYIVYTAGVGVAAAQPEAARALLRHLTSPEATAILKAKGLEPVTP